MARIRRILGSTLALAYGEAHPECCLGFMLRGIFLCRKAEIDWFLYGLRNLFPEAWRNFVAPLLPQNAVIFFPLTINA